MSILTTIERLYSPNTVKGAFSLLVLVLIALANPWFSLVAFLVLTPVLQAREKYGTLENSGFPVIKPTLFLGSEPNLHQTVFHLEDMKRFKEFGGIWGSYLGRTPHVFIADPELIRLIFVKDFAHFGDRQKYEFGADIVNEILDFQPGEKWKFIRSHLSPLLSTAKLKYMSEIVAESAKEFMDDLKNECEDGRVEFDCRNRLTTWLIDMFSRSTLGLKLEHGKNPENKFAVAFREMMAEHQDEYNRLFSLALSFPFLAKFAPTFNKEPSKLVKSTFRQMIESRRKELGKLENNKSTKDLLDVLADLWDRIPTKEFKTLGITETTVISQAIDFFLGGYDSSASAISHLLLDIAEHPEIQEKMHKELEKALKIKVANGGKPEIDHELIHDSEIPYITACINESLRMRPPLMRPERICTKDWSYKEIHIKKGTVVMLAAWPANRHPDVYSEPDKFLPERFLPENKADLDPYAFSSFGFGPRNCIGMRLAYENLKLFTCNLLKEFKVEKRADTKLEYKPGTMLVVGFLPLVLDLVKRN